MPPQEIEILIVEDSPTHAAHLRSILERNQFRVRSAENGADALGLLAQGLPRLVITDIVMPQIDGYELCRRIKLDPKFKHLPVIVFTVLSDVKDVVKSLECFADGFVLKPYDEHHLLSRIEYILANQELRSRPQSSNADKGELKLFFGGHSHILASPPKMESAIDLLLGAYETLVEQNAALSRAKDEGDRAKAEADCANRAKSEFLSSMSHELRTPLNAILGFTQLLELDERDASKRESLEQILKGGNHLLRLIGEVLDLARIEARRLELSVELINVGELLAEAVGLMQPIATPRAVQLIVPEAKLMYLVEADRQRLRQVLLNLISNAIKYNRDGGSVTVACEKAQNGAVRIVVRDTGPGIPPEKLQRLFVPFERLDAGTTKIEGAGLGLVLSKGFVEAMHGRISVDSTVGEGTSFSVELPLARNAVVKVANTAPPQQDVSTSPRRILCIEDNPSFVELIQRFIKNRPDLTVTSAPDGASGLEVARSQPFDFILLDFHLPDMKGHEVFRQLQRDRSTASIPVIVISGQVNFEQIQRLFPGDIATYLKKPLRVDDFLSAVDTLPRRVFRTERAPALAI